jgi:hypothetical protein
VYARFSLVVHTLASSQTLVGLLAQKSGFECFVWGVFTEPNHQEGADEIRSDHRRFVFPLHLDFDPDAGLIAEPHPVLVIHVLHGIEKLIDAGLEGVAAAVFLEAFPKGFDDVLAAHIPHESERQDFGGFGIRKYRRILGLLGHVEPGDVHVDVEDGGLSNAESIEGEVGVAQLDGVGHGHAPFFGSFRRRSGQGKKQTRQSPRKPADESIPHAANIAGKTPESHHRFPRDFTRAAKPNAVFLGESADDRPRSADNPSVRSMFHPMKGPERILSESELLVLDVQQGNAANINQAFDPALARDYQTLVQRARALSAALNAVGGLPQSVAAMGIGKILASGPSAGTNGGDGAVTGATNFASGNGVNAQTTEHLGDRVASELGQLVLEAFNGGSTPAVLAGAQELHGRTMRLGAGDMANMVGFAGAIADTLADHGHSGASSAMTSMVKGWVADWSSKNEGQVALSGPGPKAAQPDNKYTGGMGLAFRAPHV